MSAVYDCRKLQSTRSPNCLNIGTVFFDDDFSLTTKTSLNENDFALLPGSGLSKYLHVRSPGIVELCGYCFRKEKETFNGRFAAVIQFERNIFAPGACMGKSRARDELRFPKLLNAFLSSSRRSHDLWWFSSHVFPSSKPRILGFT